MSKSNAPDFQTFDTASVSFKQTKLEIDPKVAKNILEYVQGSQRPLLPGPISMWLNLRLNVTIEIIAQLVDDQKLQKLSIEQMRKYGISSGADAYWVPEKLL